MKKVVIIQQEAYNNSINYLWKEGISLKTLYYNGDIVTVNDAMPTAEAVVVEDGTITFVGDRATAEALLTAEDARVDLDGKTMLPGFIDGHGHIANMMAGLPHLYPAPNGTINSVDDLVSVLKDLLANGQALENGWLYACGYDNAVYPDEAHPTRYDLDKVSREVPILVMHASGHVGSVNSKAIELAGWTKDTPNENGVVLQRDENGELNGIIEERAIHVLMLNHVVQGLSPEFLMDIFVNTQKVYAAVGVTTGQEGAAAKASLPLLEGCEAQGRMLIDVVAYIMEDYDPELIPDDTAAQTYKGHVKIAGAKLVADGSPQGKTAWLTKPYYKVPAGQKDDYCGYPIYDDEKMTDYCVQALKHDWQMLVHCNGDAMGDQLIRCYKRAQDITGNHKNLRPVMIHAQTVRDDQLDEMKALGMMPSFFHDHVFYWGDYHYESVLGPERASRISPLASCVARDMPFTLHNDVPVTPINPIFNIHTAVNRITRGGRALGTEYCVDVMEAIRAVTIYGAYQHFDEKIKGSLEEGKLADMVILDKNPLKVNPNDIKNIRVLETIKNGKVIYKA